MTLVVSDRDVDGTAEAIAGVINDLQSACIRYETVLTEVSCLGLKSDAMREAIQDYCEQIKLLSRSLEDLSKAVKSVSAHYLKDIDDIDQFLY